MSFLRLATAISCLSLIGGCGGGSSASVADIDAETECGGATTAELLPCVDTARIFDDISRIALERVPASPGWQSVQDLCKSRLEAYGYQVEIASYGTGTNVVGRIDGTELDAGEVIVSAHYDHIDDCPGADDNASGVAAALEIARLLAGRESKHPLVIACWDEEETGLVGSRAYSDAAFATQTDITAMFSFDGIGFASSEPNSQTIPQGFDLLFPNEVAELEQREFRGDYIALIGDASSDATARVYEVHAESVGLPVSVLTVPEAFKLVAQTSDLRRSDHASFWSHDYPGILITDSANFRNPNYHCSNGIDLPSTLDMKFATQVTQATLGTVIDVLDGR